MAKKFSHPIKSPSGVATPKVPKPKVQTQYRQKGPMQKAVSAANKRMTQKFIKM
jgi:hypothetical protein